MILFCLDHNRCLSSLLGFHKWKCFWSKAQVASNLWILPSVAYCASIMECIKSLPSILQIKKQQTPFPNPHMRSTHPSTTGKSAELKFNFQRANRSTPHDAQEGLPLKRIKGDLSTNPSGCAVERRKVGGLSQRKSVSVSRLIMATLISTPVWLVADCQGLSPHSVFWSLLSFNNPHDW